MLSFTMGVCDSEGQLIGQQDFEEVRARDHLKIPQC